PGGDGVHPELLTTDNFEWTVVAVMSIAAHLVERNFPLRVLDVFGGPGFASSSSAPSPQEELYAGAAGIAAVADSLAALELSAAAHREPDGPDGGRETAQPFGEALDDKLAGHRQRGPLVAVVGSLSRAEAKALAALAEHGAGALALVVCDHPRNAGAVLEQLRLGGWRALAVDRRTGLPAAWSYFDDASLPAMAGRDADAAGPQPLSGRRR
ncbi:MAG: hypothetical protein ACHP7K_02010, partial [Actinomycetales bacterium]